MSHTFWVTGLLFWRIWSHSVRFLSGHYGCPSYARACVAQGWWLLLRLGFPLQLFSTFCPEKDLVTILPLTAGLGCPETTGGGGHGRKTKQNWGCKAVLVIPQVFIFQRPRVVPLCVLSRVFSFNKWDRAECVYSILLGIWTPKTEVWKT